MSYYTTKYGSPLAYSRPIDLLGQAGLQDVSGRKILDFGYGTVGHLRLLAGMAPMSPALTSTRCCAPSTAPRAIRESSRTREAAKAASGSSMAGSRPTGP